MAWDQNDDAGDMANMAQALGMRPLRGRTARPPL